MPPKRGMPPAAPSWMTETAQRLEQYKKDARQAYLPALPPPAGGTLAAPCGERSTATGLTYDRPAAELTSEELELRDLRVLGSVAASFQPQRHQIVVRGRPIVVP